MKIKIMPQDLVRHITIAQRAISNRTTMSILEAIRFEAKGDQLILRATDLEISIETKVPCQVINEGVTVISAAIIGNIFRKLPQAEATITKNGDVVDIDCLDSHFHLQVPNDDEFPDLPEVETTTETTIYSDVLRSAIQETEFATSLDESKLALTGIFFERRETELRFVALDGYRLAVRCLDLDSSQEKIDYSVIIPRRAMTEVSRIFTDDGETGIRMVPGHIVFENEKTKLFSRLIDKNYINYEEIVSTDFKTDVTVNRLDLQNALERASLLAKEERANLIKLTFSDDRLLIESNSEIGQVNEQVATKQNGDDIKIAFNAKYLLEGIRALEDDQLTLHLNGTLNPMIIRPVEGEDAYLYLVLPVRVGRD